MAIAPRNALKGYVFQNYIFTLFLAKMDTERTIKRIESEAITPGQFDDLYVEDDSCSYRIQIKNYPNTELRDIKILENTLTIKSNKNTFCPSDNNVLIVNSSLIETNTSFMGFNAIDVDGIVIIPMTEEDVTRHLDEMFKSEIRELQIIQLAQKLTSKAKFMIETNDLPELIRISTDLENQTVLLREPIDINQGITYIVGQPGIGKSHYVNEMIHKHCDSILYRFWTSSQDDNIKKRLMFNCFIEDLGLAVYNSSRNFELQDLIDEINTRELTIFIDGLDHVENYNVTELQDYINFINSLTSAKVVVLSRPLKVPIHWSTIELCNWSFDELYLYLASAYDINEYSLAQKIFSVSDGYPIITYFLAENYKLTGELNIDCQLSNLNQYYDILLKDVNIRTPLTLFATNNSFFLLSELEDLLDSQESSETTKEFIQCYPYLFKKVINRVSLIHDSLNTYLKSQLSLYSDKRKVVTEKIKNSLMSGNVRYMSRMSSFDFEEDFFDELLRRYGDFAILKKLLQESVDYNSLTDFYNQLQLILEKRNNVFNIYQLYAFSLIHQCVNRNDLIGFDEVVYQILKYINRYGDIEEQIFSSGTMWNLFIMLKTGNPSEYKRYLSNKFYSSNDIYNVYEKINEAVNFFNIKEMKIDFAEILPKLLNEKTSQLDKREILIQYFLSVWINTEKNAFYDSFNEFINGNEQGAINRMVLLTQQYNIDEIWISSSLNAAKYQLHELGYFGEQNMFRNKSLKDFILEYAPEGSFDVAQYVESFLKLANYENREVDINSVNLVWAMYYMRKDYSVCNLDIALLVFENHNLINETESLEIIKRVMNQSEKGIRLLLTSYINRKPISFTQALVEQKFFDDNCRVSISELSPEHIDCFDISLINNKIAKLLRYHYSLSIDYYDVKNILISKHCDLLLKYLKYNYYTVRSVYDVEAMSLFDNNEIKYETKYKEEPKEYVPFDNGCIHKEDFEYIVNNHISHLDICHYTDGWHHSFPFVEIYMLYEKEIIKEDYLKIIHNSMFARISSIQHIGYWSLLLGNIPQFLNQLEINIDWEQLYKIFRNFLDISLIWPESPVEN